ncbi:TIGR03089 family protein [Dermabacter sp. p3-SID358]|uniref:TIGR03089 family protein n=1 Tax=Dermabacter sp. p3-SID358 TaxID=2916114 RepID=UPI0021A5823D|nr:TIGR03089 family protein [Dermabacter sp. p3-SID358]MCT1866720.1 TIGR03089 family protein [Dermabacter sp. p3-SID358]
MSRLLEALITMGSEPALVSYADDGRTELSGRVLANWIVKSINLFGSELLVDEGFTLVLDLPPHFKRSVLQIAAWHLGAKTHIAGSGDVPEQIDVLATSKPNSALADQAGDILVLEPRALSLAFPGEMPPLALDWVQTVRAAGDNLETPLAHFTGPEPAPRPEWGSAHRVGLEEIDLGDAAAALAAWIEGRTVVAPLSRLNRAARASEGIDFPASD